MRRAAKRVTPPVLHPRKAKKGSKHQSKEKSPSIIEKRAAAERAAVHGLENGVDINELVASLPDDVNVGEVLTELCNSDPVIWTMVKRRLRKMPLTYDVSALINAGKTTLDVLLRHRPFLIQPLRDQSKHKCYIKSRQVGVSELSITEVLQFLDTHGADRKAIYCFPREKQLEQFSSTRLNPAFEESPLMAALLGTPNQTFLKRIGSSFLLLRSTWESNLGEGVDADFVTFDEKDRMKPGIDVAFKESLKSSPFGYLRELSTPTLPGRGIDEVWKKSDQHLWHVKCTKCGLAQPIDYPDNFVQLIDYPQHGITEIPQDSWTFACRRPTCRGTLDRLHGHWVPTHPDRQLVRGYHITQMMCPWITATGIMQELITYKFRQLWENYVLGRISKGESILISDNDLIACSSHYQLFTHRTRDWAKISIGIDWGATNWFVVLGLNAHNNRRYVIGIGIIEDDYRDALNMNDVIGFLTPYEPDIIIADAGYGKDRNAKLLKHFDPTGQLERFFACFYNPSTKASRTFQPQWGDARVLVDRTISLKMTCRGFKDREIGLAAGDQKTDLLKKHLKALAPLKEQDEETKEIYETIEATGPDHLAHALTYANLGMDKICEVNQFSWSFV
jgi:hypothetical protein